MAFVGEAHLDDVQGQGGPRESGVRNYGFTNKRMNGVLGDRACGGGMKDLREGGKLLDIADCDPT